ncbi:sialate O-acetylesterase [Thalassotalea sp. PLHSN55]|uniref:sialate O-acetylesterase n=1 Tax=Thalassotalea sp. PLHSN55 TaxID=3435888 RepID=UPI003F87B0FD
MHTLYSSDTNSYNVIAQINAKTSIINLLLLVFMLSCLSGCIVGFNSKTKPPINIVLLAGQSNMAGAGNYNALSVDTIKRIKAIQDRVTISVDNSPLQPLSYTYSDHHLKKYGFGETFGPELYMALTLAEQNPKQHYVFIKTAVGGTSLQGAWNPNWSQEKANTAEKGHKQQLKLFSQHINQTKQVLAQLEKNQQRYKISALVWLQGENDAARELRARHYHDNLTALISAYRHKLKTPNLTVLIGQINSTYGNFPQGPAMVRNAQKQAAETDSNVYLITTSTNSTWQDFPKHIDNVHYNTQGQTRLGKVFANTLINITK